MYYEYSEELRKDRKNKITGGEKKDRHKKEVEYLKKAKIPGILIQRFFVSL